MVGEQCHRAGPKHENLALHVSAVSWSHSIINQWNVLSACASICSEINLSIKLEIWLLDARMVGKNSYISICKYCVFVYI